MSNLPSKFSFRCSIRLLEARVFDSNFEFAFFVSLLYSTSRISLLYSTSRNRSSNSTSRSSTSRFKCLEFRIRLDLFDFSNFDLRFRFEIVVESFVALVEFSKSNSSFEFLIELFNFRRNSAICIALMH